MLISLGILSLFSPQFPQTSPSTHNVCPLYLPVLALQDRGRPIRPSVQSYPSRIALRSFWSVFLMVQEPRPLLGLRQPARLPLSKDPIPAFGHQAVSQVSQRARHDPEDGRQTPGKPQFAGDAEHGGGPGRDPPVFHEINRLHPVGIGPVALQQLSSGFRTVRGEPEHPSPVVPEDEIHTGVAEVALAVENDHGFQSEGPLVEGVGDPESTLKSYHQATLMRLWAIADLHLSHARPDPRERFAGRWRDHAEKIANAWKETVSDDDLVLLPGDLSMARNHRDVQPDLAWLDRLPGRKVLSAGNHDLWFNGVGPVRRLLRRSQLAVGGDALKIGDVIVCGAKGAPVPPDDSGHPRDAKALAEIDRALSRALELRSASEPVLVLWHYPPFDPLGRPGPVVSRLESAGVSLCVYGHLHQQGQWSSAVQGVVGSVRYHCVAADAIGFRPLALRIGRG